ncbi:MAG: efflux RND transporter periplasmic adaptor subunit [Patescibacteria group bacterium]|nr:efflux RND transporter periplasmic adaptor subunit [Patescibacteria group bacterium]
MNKIGNFRKWILGSKKRIAIFVILLLTVGYFGYKGLTAKAAAPQYQTAQAEKGTLINSVTASGNITTANNVSVTIQAAGVVKEVFVKNGDQVGQGQTLATLTLDQASQQKQAAAYASYLTAKNTLDAANAKYNSLQNTLFTDNQKFINDAVARGLATNDPTYIEENATWLQAEADYKNQASVISANQSSLTAASLNLSQLSSNITAPVAGEVRGLTIAPGSIVTVTSSSSNSTSTSQVLGSIFQEGPTQAQVSISEIDAPKVTEGDKVTMTLDAFPDATFTGKVASINTNGVVSSGVTSYPAVISFDAGNKHIYPNMAVTAKIITSVKNDVILVPSAAVQAGQNGQITVRVLKNGQVETVPVEVGNTNDTQTGITSGINEGDTVITGITNPTAKTGSSGATSPFGSRGFGGGGVIMRGGGR